MFTGPNIVKDGLVLSLDAGTIRSFRGEPTSNLISNNFDTTFETLSDGNTAGFSNQLGGSFGVSNIRGYNSNKSLRTTSNGSDSRRRIYRTISVTQGQYFTVSAWVYCTVPNGALITIEFNGGDYTWGVGQTGNSHQGTGWEKIWRSITVPATSNTTGYYFLRTQSVSDNVDIFWDDIQIENKPYPTPFVNGTRGTTVASGGGWADLSQNNNHGELVNGPTFNNNNFGSIQFDGVNDYISLINSNWSSIFNNNINNNFTLSLWLNPSNIGIDQALISQRHGDAMSLFLMQNGKITLEMDDTQNYVGTNTILQNNNWYNISVSFYNNTVNSYVEYYINGIFERSETKYDGNGISVNNNLWIGWQSRNNYGRNPTYFNGNMSNILIYNKALTSTEVLQNYNATKNRYL